MKVGTKKLTNRLSHTDRAAVVAELQPPRVAQSSDHACLQALEEEGLLTIGKKKLPAFEPLTPRGEERLSEMVIEDRG